MAVGVELAECEDEGLVDWRKPVCGRTGPDGGDSRCLYYCAIRHGFCKQRR